MANARRESQQIRLSSFILFMILQKIQYSLYFPFLPGIALYHFPQSPFPSIKASQSNADRDRNTLSLPVPISGKLLLKPP